MNLNSYSSQSSNQKSRLFFLEFLIVLFFFLIISTVCIRLFAHAKKISFQAEILSQAQTMASSAAEILIAEQGDLTFLQEQHENISSSCIMNISSEKRDSVIHFLIQIYSADTSTDSDPVYELPVDLHIPLTRREVLP